MNVVPGTRPGWVSDELFPFRSKFIDIDGHTIHYIDEGDGPVLLMLHGNPAWSFLYRHLIAGLAHRCRCVALDYPGFGLSTARSGYGFRPADHAAVVEAFVTRLGLERLVPVLNDWGGPVGLWVAGRHPERISGLIIGNTWAWPVTGDKHFERFAKLMGGPLGRLLIRRFNLFVNALVPGGHPHTKLTRAEMDHYRRPFPTAESRMPTAILPREIIQSASWLAEVDRGLTAISDKPVLITWGDRDAAFRAPELERFQATFPQAITVILRGAGHFVADDAAEEMIAAIARWMTDLATS